MSNVRLELVWPNKDKFLLSPEDENGKPVWVDMSHPAAREVRLIEFGSACGEVNNDQPFADNLLFVGDSGDALRNLSESPSFRKEYRGKVKLIYIDPPFNTGQTFVHYDDWMEHSTWLSFMRDRLQVMKELLSPDGTIWVHLDDAEQHRMRAVMDEVFGASGFIANFVWEKKKKPSFLHGQVATVTDTIMVYAKNRSLVPAFTLGGSTEGKGIPFHNKGNSVGVLQFPAGSVSFGLADQVVPKGDMSTDTIASELLDDVEIVDGTNRNAFRMSGEWRYSQSALDDFVEEGAEIRISRSPFRPNYIRADSLAKKITNVFSFRVNGVGTNEDAKSECKEIFGSKIIFDTPKPESLLERIIGVASNPGDIVLDCFAGSGTTAAVAHKMKRRWLTVELSASTASQFTIPRLTAVVNGTDLGGVSGAVGWHGGGGFRVLEIQPSFYAVTPVGVMLTDDAFGPRFARAVAGQLGFDWEAASGLFCGRRGRMRLAVFDGAVGLEELSSIQSELAEDERVTVVARVVLPGAEEWLAENSRGSLLMKAPGDVLRERRKRRRAVEGEK